MIVDEPDIRKTKFTKDFGWGFYCTEIKEQAEKWAIRKTGHGYINLYEYNDMPSLKIKTFDGVDDEWLDFIAQCRHGDIHEFDIVEGPMADDTIYNFVEDYLEGIISKEAFMELAKFRKPTHQISFHTIKALSCLKFQEALEVVDNE